MQELKHSICLFFASAVFALVDDVENRRLLLVRLVRGQIRRVSQVGELRLAKEACKFRERLQFVIILQDIQATALAVHVAKLLPVGADDHQFLAILTLVRHPLRCVW